MGNAAGHARIMARVALGAGLAFALTPGFASQPTLPAQAPPDEIVVTGERLTAEEIRQRAVEFVRGTGVANGETPVARWVQPVCIRVTGIRDDQAQRVQTTMLAIADAARVPAARGECRHNILVGFTADAAALIDEIHRHAPMRLVELSRNDRETLLEGTAPVRWWYTTGYLGRHGQGSMAQSLSTVGSDGSGGLPISAETVQHYDSSMISTQVVRILKTATVVIDANGVRGRSLEAVGAYAALVAFAEIRDLEFAPRGSILSLFESPTAPRELADQDMAFLRALYRLPLDRQAMRHRGLLIGGMVEATREDAAGGRNPR
jgi:hypothetical protein